MISWLRPISKSLVIHIRHEAQTVRNGVNQISKGHTVQQKIFMDFVVTFLLTT